MSSLILPPEVQCLCCRHTYKTAGLLSLSCVHTGMLLGLRAAGYQSIHIMAHSMGVRVVLASIERLKELFIKPRPPGDQGGWDEGAQGNHPNADDSEVEVRASG